MSAIGFSLNQAHGKNIDRYHRLFKTPLTRRQQVARHGTTDMPIWGDRYSL